MALKTTHVVAIILVIAIAACAAVVLANGNNDSADYIDVKTSVVKGDDVQQVVIESNKDIFKEVTTDAIIIFVTDLESYVHGDWFDNSAYSEDLYAYGHEDEYYGVVIPADAVKYTGDDVTVSQDGKNKLSVEFQASSLQYGIYQIVIDKDVIELDCIGLYEDVLDVPTGEMITPSIEITDGIYEFQSNPSIEVTISEGTFADVIQPDYIVLGGGFSGLTVSTIDRTSDNKMTINTTGTVPRCSGISGIVTLSADAYSGPAWCTEDILSTDTVIDYNTVILDTYDMDIDSGYENLIIPIYFSQSYYDRLCFGELTIRAFDGTADPTTVILKDVLKIEGDDSFTGYIGCLYVPVEILLQDKFDNIMLCSDGEQIADLTTYSDSIIATVYEVSDDCKKFKVCVMPTLEDFVSGVTADSFIFPDGFTVDSFTIEEGVAYIELTTSEKPTSQRYTIEVKAGTFINLFGELNDEMVLSVAFTESETLTEGTVFYAIGGEPSVDDMIKYMYGAQKFNDIYGLVELGVGVLSTILEATGIIEIPDPEQMRFEMLMLQCERIQIMLADINAKLDNVSNQIMKLDGKIDKVQMTQLRNQYSEYVKAVNNLENTSALFAKHLKTRMYNEVINGSGVFYIYLVENNKTKNESDIFSIKHGDYNKNNTGGVIGGQKVLKTVALPIGASTFKETSQLPKYVDGKSDKPGTTAYCMLKDLTDYYKLNPIEGYSPENLAKGTYKAIIYKFMELATAQEGGDSDKLINAYKEFASLTASLHNGVYDANIVNNYHAGIEYVEYKYNFYSETKDILRTMNYSAAMNVFFYGAFVNVLDQISISSDDTLPKYMEAGIKYLKDNTGARDSNAYSYVAHGNLSLGKMKIHSDATFKSKDNFDGHVYENLEGNNHWNNLGNNRYVNTEMIKKMNQRWQALGSPESTLAKYITKHTGVKLGTFLMTKFEGEGDFSAGDLMYLQTAKEPIMSGKANYRIMPAKTWLTLANEFSAIKTYSETFDKNIKKKFTYNGEVLNLSNLEPVKVGGKTNCMYAYAAVIDHRWNFVFDEANYFTSYGYYDDDWFGYAVTGDKQRQYEHETILDYLRIS